MEKPKASILPLPASAHFHFALAQDEYVGVLSACQYFAKNLRNDHEKATMLRALAKLDRPTGISVPSEAEVEPVATQRMENYKPDDIATDETPLKPKTEWKKPAASTKGLAGLGGRKV